MMSGKYLQKICLVKTIVSKGGFTALIAKLGDYIRYHLDEKWQFVYFELNVEDFSFSSPNKDGSILVRQATEKDIPKIETELYPHFTAQQEYDKRHISQLGKKGISCFIAEQNNQIVHYFMLFEKALESPLMITPIKKSLISENDAFLGNAFTLPSARGFWILPEVLASIFSYLSSKNHIRKAILLAHEDTPGAINFFKKIGFHRINDAASPNYFFKKIGLLLYKKNKV